MTSFAVPSPETSIEQDVRDIEALDIVGELLKVVCRTTGMGFAAIARVTDTRWTALAVQDDIQFGLRPGGSLVLETTLCHEVHRSGRPITIDQASTDPVYREHHTPRLYGIESYISVPIVMTDGRYFGNLCAIDPRPAKVADENVLSMFTLFARLIALQLENNQRRAAAEAAVLDERAAGELREQFIAILGHDLRNPVAGVAACAQVLQRRSTDPEVLGLAARIQNNVRRMGGLIDDVLDFARGRLGGGFGVHLAPEPELQAALGSVVAELCDAHPQREVQVLLRIGEPVCCDRRRLEQLASNLLANALTHGSPAAPVQFSAVLEADALVIRVANQGEPIPADSLPRVFSPFWRARSRDVRQGLGLGLFICAQIVQAHGGTLEVHSDAATGTEFVARLPKAGRG